MSNLEGRAKKRNQQACTSCRQVKLRCDGKETFPAACSRCQKNQLECRTDSTFKRVRTRHRLDEVTSQLNAIQKTLGIRTGSTGAEIDTKFSTPSATAEDILSSPRPNSSASPQNASKDPTSKPEELNFYRTSDANDIPDSPITIGGISLETVQVKELFTQFQDHYYRHCPILDTDMSVADLYSSSPFLFSTIIIIASQWHTSLSSLYRLIVEPYRLMLGSVLQGPILELNLLHGIILLCFWPLAVAKQLYDPSWNYCGLITNVAVQMGLQNSSSGRDALSNQRSEREDTIRAKTWMACVQINSMFAWNHGLAMSTEIARGPGALTQPSSILGLDFKVKTVLQQQSVKSALLMANVNNTTDFFQYTQAVVNDLETLKDRYRATWGIELDIMLLSAQIKVYAFQLQAQGQEHKDLFGANKKSELDISCKALQQCAFTAAIRLIHLFSELVDNPKNGPNIPACSQNGDTQVLHRYLPKNFFNALLFAAFFIFRCLAFRASEPSSAETELARNHIQLTYRILSSMSLVPHDEPARATKMMEVLSRAHDLSRLKMSELRPDLGSRLYLLEDMIRAAQEIRKDVLQTVDCDNNEPKYTEIASNSVESSGYTAPSRRPGIPNPHELPESDVAFDMGQDFDWNSLLGFDYSMSQLPDFETDDNFDQNITRD